MECSTIEYPALIYKNDKNNVFVANCIMKRIIGFGKTEQDAINNLESVLNKSSDEYFIRIRPMYNLSVPI